MNSSITKVSVLLLTLTPSLLLAQTDQENNNRDNKENPLFSVLDEIIVTGEIQTRNTQDTTTSISVFNAEKLEATTDVSVYDTINRTANANSAQSFNIRGIDINGAGGAGTGQTINISVDGASASSNQATIFGPYSVWDLEQVEVLRGPQSTQQGRNALAGSINLRSKDPDFERETKIRLKAGEHGETNLALSHNQPLNDNWAARIAVERNHSDGFITNITTNNDESDERDLSLLRGKLLYEPSDDLKVVFSHGYTENGGGNDTVQRDLLPDRSNISDIEAEEKSLHNITGLKVDYNINDRWSLHSETTYYRHNYEQTDDFDQTATPFGTTNAQTDEESISQELKFIYDNGGKLHGAFGIYATHIESELQNDFSADPSIIVPGVPAGVAVLNSDSDGKNTTQNLALFGEFDYDISNDWTFIVGARYDDESIDVNNTVRLSLDPADVLPIPLPADDILDTETSYNAFLPKVGIKYNINDDINTSFIIQRGYRSGGTERNSFTLEVTDYDPEFTTNYEFSVRSRFWNDRIQLNGNLFYTEWEDQQVRVNGPSGQFADNFVLNAGESTVYGAELEFEIAPNDKLQAYSSIGYAKTEFDTFINQGVDLSGNEFAFAPRVTASIGGKYKFNPQWSLQLDGNYAGDFYGEVENTSNVKGRFFLDAKFGYEQPKWSAHLYARNLFDKEYLTRVLSGGQRARLGEPRVAGLEFNAKF